MKNPALRIFLGLVLGAALGAFAAPRWPWVAEILGRLTGEIFLHLLLALVMPLAVLALVLGILELQPGALKGVVGRAFGLTLGLTSVAVAIGLVLVRWVRPGAGVDPATLPHAGEVSVVQTGWVDLLVGVVPSNVFASAAKGDLLGVLVIAVLFGLALRRLPDAAPLVLVLQKLFSVFVRAVEMVMTLAPVGVAGLVCTLVARAGLEGLLPVARLAGVTVGAIAIQALVVYPLVLRFLGRRSPIAYYKAVEPALVLAFSTASSAATLPTTLRVAEEGLGLPRQVSRFVLTVGASANQNGSALYEGIVVLFLAQLYGVELSVAQQALVVGIAILAGVGTAGVPGASLPVIAAIAASLGIPVESVGALLGVDRLLDMCRTFLNVDGDLVIAAVVSRGASEAAPPATPDPDR